jgi:hypothetical protein
VAKDEDTRRRMSTTLREFYDVQGIAPARFVHDLQRGQCGTKPDLDPVDAIVKPRPRGTRPGWPRPKLQRSRSPRQTDRRRWLATPSPGSSG